MHFIWVSMYLTQSTNWGHSFYVSYWRQDRHFTWSSEPREGLAICRAKGVPSFLSYFKTLSVGLVAGIEPATSPNAVKRSTDWANPVRLNSDSDGSEFFSPMTVTQEVNFALF